MQGGKRGGPHKKHPTYLGVFAKDSKDAHKTVRGVCKDTLLDVLKQFNPQAYLQEGQNIDKTPPTHEQERDPTEEEVIKVEKDLSEFQAFQCPQDNYHLTCLYIGNKLQKLNKKQEQIYKGWKEGHKQNILVDFIVYVPGHIMTAYSSDVGQVDVDNEYPHMTLLLKGGTSAVQSNNILEILAKVHPGIFKQRQKKVTALHIPFKGSQILFVIDRKFEIQGHCGNNFQHGRLQK